LPLQPPDALQEVAFVDDQFNVDSAPLATVLGVAVNVTIGAAEVTVTVADCTALPPAPLQVSVYVAFAVSAPVDRVPFRPWLPDQFPDATHDVAFVDDQLRVDALPLATVLGVAVKVTVGAEAVTVTVADCAAVPPAPVQVRE
jgi:hypothetical protein